MKYPGFPDIQIRNIKSSGNDLTFYYNQNGRRRKFEIINFPWYFVMKTTEATKFKPMLLEYMQKGLIEKVEKTADGEYVKFYTDKQGGRKDSTAMMVMQMLESKGAQILEGDFYSAKRFLVDYDCEVSDEYNILYFDIETDDTNSVIEIGAAQILSIAAIDTNGKEYYNDDPDELALLDWANKLFAKYDVIAGWNIKKCVAMGVVLSQGFDLPYIAARYEKFGKRFPLWDYASIDMMARCRRLFKDDSKIKSFSLESICQHFLKKGKVKRIGKIIDLYNNDRAKFKEYNLTDVRLLKELDEQVGIIDLIAKQCRMTKTLIRDFDGVNVSKPLDNLIIQKAHEKGIFVPSKVYKDRSQVAEIDLPDDSYVGGYVYEPKTGLHESVYVFDFKSLYPSIIMTSNIGFDTVTRDSEKMPPYLTNPGTGVKFRKDKKSVVAEAVEFLVEARQSYKEHRLELTAKNQMHTDEYETTKASEIIVKEMANSMYGVLGNKYSRWYSIETAESITKMGQYLLKWTYNWFNTNGWEAIYGDTDSVFVKMVKVKSFEKSLDKYHKELKKHLATFGIDKSAIYLKYEKLYKSLVMVKKKLYAGYLSNIEGKEVDEFDAKGIDLRKKATSPLVMEIQKNIIDMVLTGKPEREIMDYVFALEEDVLTKQYTFDQIRTVRNAGKDMDAYTDRALVQPHIIIAKRIIERQGYLESKEIEYVYVDHKNKILAERHEYTGVFDRRLFWNENILSPILRILEAAYPNVDWSGNFKIKAKDMKQRVIEGQKTLF